MGCLSLRQPFFILHKHQFIVKYAIRRIDFTFLKLQFWGINNHKQNQQ
jgi:hypothetical protein